MLIITSSCTNLYSCRRKMGTLVYNAIKIKKRKGLTEDKTELIFLLLEFLFSENGK